MFDIGFAELVVIGIVGLLVIGPERLPGAIRTASFWLGRLRRGFNEIKHEVQQELHNDSVMQELRETGERLKEDTQDIGQEIKDSAQALVDDNTPTTPTTPTTITTPDNTPEKKGAE